MSLNTPYVEPPISTYLNSKAIANKVPVSATFELTSRCNFNCKMCYIHSSKPADKSEELSAEEWISIAKDAYDLGVLFLLITGGEPMLRSDFPEIYTALAKMGFVISMNSNASLISEEMFDLFEKYPPQRVNVSLYGGKEHTYSELCGTEKFRTVLNNIRRLKGIGVQVVIHNCITPYNADDLVDVKNLADELGCHLKTAPYMYPPMRKDTSLIGENDGRFSPEEAARKRLEFDEAFYGREVYLSRCRKITEEIEKLRKIEIKELFYEGFPVLCRAGRSSMWVDWRGNVLACGMFGTGGVSLKKSTLKEAWDTIRNETKGIRLPLKCRICVYQPICNICAAVALTETGKYDEVPEYVCRMTKYTAKLMKEEAEKENETEKETDTENNSR